MTRENPVILKQLHRLTTRNELTVNATRKSFLTVLFAVGLFSAKPSFAGLLTINNPSFENPVVTSPNYYTYGTQGQSSVTGWDIAGAGAAGVQDTAHFVGDVSPAPDGAQFGFLNNGTFDQTTLSQTLAYNLQPDTQYTLTIDVSGRSATSINPGTGYSITLYGGASALGAVTPITPPTMVWTPLSATYTSPHVVTPGTPLEIQIAIQVNSTFEQLDFDNVTLSATPVPEPGTWKIAGALLLAPLAFRAVRLLRKPARI
jgi:hypothetical protein